MNRPLVVLLPVLGLAVALGAQAAPSYRMDSAKSSLRFVAEQTGGKFEGSFKHFDALIAFSPTDLASSRFDVTVDPASAETQDADRNQTIVGPDFFDVAHFRTAHFVTTTFRAIDATHFEATGKLTLRDVTRDVKIAFTFSSRKEGAGEAAYLAGTADLKRLEFGVGRGDYKDTDTVGDPVQVKFNLRLTPPTHLPDKKIPTTPSPAQSQ
ncbi:MAG TPA: YceI family protein [Steroidobacteraceae bacterium]|nr:YceI family protein [Steroidobacteraceae bacterium]